MNDNVSHITIMIMTQQYFFLYKTAWAICAIIAMPNNTVMAMAAGKLGL